MIYLTGDLHASIDIHKLSKRYFDDSNLTKNDYLIILGDFGLIWNKSDPESKYWLDWLNAKNYTTLFIDGNHENHPLLNTYPEEIWNGGRIHKIHDSIFHLMRGQIFTIDDHTFFAMGGADSIDKIYRRRINCKGVSDSYSSIFCYYFYTCMFYNINIIKTYKEAL